MGTSGLLWPNIIRVDKLKFRQIMSLLNSTFNQLFILIGGHYDEI